VIGAVLFFFLFALVITGLSTVKIGIALFPIYRDIRQAFESGEFPEITIRNGVATIDAEQPFVLFNEEGTIIVLDTSGTYQELDPLRYRQGLLLTRTALHLLNDDGRYQVIPLCDLQELLGADPMVINADLATRFWIGFSVIATVLAFVFIAIWNTLVRFMYLAMLALVIWGLIVLFRPGTGFGPVLITGLYAVIPAMYVHYLLGLLRIRFIFLQTILLLPVWAVALVAALAGRDNEIFGGERSLRGWRTLIGIPLVFTLALDVVFELPRRAFITWPVALLTFVVLVVVGLLTARRPRQSDTPGELEAVDSPEVLDQPEMPESV